MISFLRDGGIGRRICLLGLGLLVQALRVEGSSFL